MSLNPSLALIPSAFKAGKLYSVLPEDGSGDFDVSRNGNATYFDKDGLLKTAQANEPRFEFDPVTGEFRGVLVEPAATNLITYSENFQQWSIFNGATLTSGAISPTGENNAFNLSFDGATNGRIETIVPTTEDYSFSVWLKTISGTASVILGTGSLNLQTFTIDSVWRRYSGLFTDGRFPRVRCDQNTIIQVFGAQLETGSVATSYIPTFGSQVTRPADQITVTVPMSATQCFYILNGVQEVVPVTGGETFTLPNGIITQLYMV